MLTFFSFKIFEETTLFELLSPSNVLLRLYLETTRIPWVSLKNIYYSIK